MVCVEQNLGREAYESMQKAVELDPDNPLVNYAMGAIATNRHEPSESLPYFEKYVRLRPDDPRGHFALGAALFYSNLFDGPVPRSNVPPAPLRRPPAATASSPASPDRRTISLRRAGKSIARCSSMPVLSMPGGTGIDSDPAGRLWRGRAVARQGARDRCGSLRGLGEPGDALRRDERSAQGRADGQDAALGEKRDSGPRHSCASSRPCPTNNDQDRRHRSCLRDRFDLGAVERSAASGVARRRRQPQSDPGLIPVSGALAAGDTTARSRSAQAYVRAAAE